jgi:hypothetical protein
VLDDSSLKNHRRAEARVSKPTVRWLERIGFIGVGAVLGAAIAKAVELTGHRWWALLIVLACVLAPSALRGFVKFRTETIFPRFRPSQRVKVVCVLLMIGVTLAIYLASGLNPRDYGYAPLLPPVILASLLFGFGHGLLAVIICTVTADYLFALPEFDFVITDVEDAVGLAVFAILGAFIALAIHNLVPPDEA